MLQEVKQAIDGVEKSIEQAHALMAELKAPVPTPLAEAILKLEHVSAALELAASIADEQARRRDRLQAIVGELGIDVTDRPGMDVLIQRLNRWGADLFAKTSGRPAGAVIDELAKRVRELEIDRMMPPAFNPPYAAQEDAQTRLLKAKAELAELKLSRLKNADGGEGK